jgi:hypothetical protein
MVMGVPVGAHTEALDCSTSGCPPASTRVLPTNPWPVMQGPLPAVGGGMEQPATK